MGRQLLEHVEVAISVATGTEVEGSIQFPFMNGMQQYSGGKMPKMVVPIIHSIEVAMGAGTKLTGAVDQYVFWSCAGKTNAAIMNIADPDCFEAGGWAFDFLTEGGIGVINTERVERSNKRSFPTDKMYFQCKQNTGSTVTYYVRVYYTMEEVSLPSMLNAMIPFKL